MEATKIVYQRKSPRQQLLHKRTLRTSSPIPIKDQSSKLFRIQVNTPTFYRPNLPPSMNTSPAQYSITTSRPKRKRVSYLPNSSVYKKLNVRLTLHNLEFTQTVQAESRTGTRSQMRKTIDFTTHKQNSNQLTPLEARGLSVNYVLAS
jgi:hypothetical protein